MFKSIFLKQLTTFGLIILLSFVLLISIIMYIVNSYSLSQNSESVKWTAAAAKATIEESIKINDRERNMIVAFAPQPIGVGSGYEALAGGTV